MSGGAVGVLVGSAVGSVVGDGSAGNVGVGGMVAVAVKEGVGTEVEGGLVFNEAGGASRQTNRPANRIGSVARVRFVLFRNLKRSIFDLISPISNLASSMP